MLLIISLPKLSFSSLINADGVYTDYFNRADKSWMNEAGTKRRNIDTFCVPTLLFLYIS